MRTQQLNSPRLLQHTAADFICVKWPWQQQWDFQIGFSVGKICNCYGHGVEAKDQQHAPAGKSIGVANFLLERRFAAIDA